MNSELRRKQILIVTNDAWFFVSHRLPIAAAIVQAGATCHVAAHRDDSVAQIIATGSLFHHWKISPRGRSLFTELKTIYSLYKLISSVKPDILHLVTIKPVLYGGLLARLMKVNSVVFAISGMGHLFQDKATKPTLLQRLAQVLYQVALKHKNAAVIVQNSSDGAFFTESMNIPTGQVYQLPGSGVDLKHFTNNVRHNDIPLIVLTARMLWDKGVKYFFEAALKLKQQGITARFALVGHTDQGNPRSVPLEKLIEWQESGVVEYWGHRDNINELLLEADIFCLPTIYGEGLPKSILEALASGCAVVTTDWPGCNEIIDNGVNGLLVPPKDIDALTEALLLLIKNPKLRHQLGTAGRKTVEAGYGVDVVVTKTLSIYKALEKTNSNHDSLDSPAL